MAKHSSVVEATFKERKLVERLLLLWLACFIRKYKSLNEGQVLQEHFFSWFADFYYHKIFETRWWWHKPLLPLCNWRYKDLSMSHDQKVMTILPHWRSAIWVSIKELFLLRKFDNSSPSVIKNRDLSHD